MTATLKPCPFCGKSPIYSPRWPHMVICANCDTTGPLDYNSREGAEQKWNTRKERDDVILEKCVVIMREHDRRAQMANFARCGCEFCKVTRREAKRG